MDEETEPGYVFSPIEYYFCDNCLHGFLPHEVNRDYEGKDYCPYCDDEISMTVEPWTSERANELSAWFGW